MTGNPSRNPSGNPSARIPGGSLLPPDSADSAECPPAVFPLVVWAWQSLRVLTLGTLRGLRGSAPSTLRPPLYRIYAGQRVESVSTGTHFRYRNSLPYLPEVTSGGTGSEFRRYRKSLPPTTPSTYSYDQPIRTPRRSRVAAAFKRSRTQRRPERRRPAVNLTRLSVLSFSPATPGYTVTVEWSEEPATYDVVGWAIVVVHSAKDGEPAETDLQPVFIEDGYLTYPSLLLGEFKPSPMVVIHYPGAHREHG